MKKQLTAIALSLLATGFIHAEDQPLKLETGPLTLKPGPDKAEPAQSLTELNKQLVNPVSSLWSITFQENNYWVNMPGGHSSQVQNNLLLQPVLPVSLTENWNLITRPVIPLVNSVPYVNSAGNVDRATGFGDTSLIEMVSPGPNLVGGWLTGLGPTAIFPTASDSHLGQGKWQIGPAAVVGYLGKGYAIGVFPQQWWSVAGYGPRNTSQFNMQYFAVWFPGNGWSVGTSPNMLVDWYADSGNKVTFPLGLSVGKVVKIGRLPVKFAIEGQYMPVHPDAYGQEWNIQIKISPVIPKLIKGNLFGE